MTTLEHKILSTDKLEVLPPFDIEVEKAVLYCLLHSKEARESAGKISTVDFYDPANKQLFGEIDFSDENFNVLTIPTKFKTSKVYLQLFGENYLLSQFDIYLSRLKELTTARELESICYKAVTKIREGEKLSKIKSDIVKKVEDINIKISNDIVNIKDIDCGLEEYYKNINNKVIKTNFSILDGYLFGLQKGVFYIVGGVPGVGKSTFVLNLMNNICKQKYNVLFVSLEMPYKEVKIKLISEITKIDTNKMKLINYEDEKNLDVIKKINNAEEKIYNYNLNFMGAKKIFMYEIDDAIKNIGNIDIVFIDYLQKIRAGEGINRYEKISIISSDISALALRYDIPIVVVSSVNRANADRANKEPILSDLRDSGNLEFDAGVVLFLHRPGQFDEEVARSKAKIILAKNRYGTSNVNIDLMWKPQQSKFYESEARYENGSRERKDIY